MAGCEGVDFGSSPREGVNADRITKLGRDSGKFQGGEVGDRTWGSAQSRCHFPGVGWSSGGMCRERPYPAVLVGSDLMQGAGLILDKLTGGQGLLH